MARKITTDMVKTKLVAECGGAKADWKRLSKKKNGAGQWTREFENKKTGDTVQVTEDGKGGLIVDTSGDPGLTAQANAGFAGANAPSPGELKDFADRFHDEITHTLDDIMDTADPAQAQQMAKYFATIHEDTEYPAAAFAGVKVDIAELMTGEDAYTEEDVAQKFAELGFKVEDGHICYENTIDTARPEAAAADTAPAEANPSEDLKYYLDDMFIDQVMYAKSIERFEDDLDEYNCQNEYNADVPVAEITLADLKNIDIEQCLERFNKFASTKFTVTEVEEKLGDLGFVIKDGTVLHHEKHQPGVAKPGSKPGL